MEVPTPAKRATGQLACLVSSADYTSGESEYSDDASANHSGLVHDVCQGRDGAFVAEEILGSQDAALEEKDLTAVQIVKSLMYPPIDANLFHRVLAADVYQIAWRTSSGSKPAFRRAVMARLRALGYNAGLCQTRYDDSWGLPAGCYEYIDVMSVAAGDGKLIRYIVDLDFDSKFEVARPTEKYKAVVAVLPQVAVVEEAAMWFAVLTVAEAANRSLTARGLFVAPWRAPSFMLAKWFGPYQRTINPDPAAKLGYGVNLRTVGLQSTEEPSGGEMQRRVVGFAVATELPFSLPAGWTL